MYVIAGLGNPGRKYAKTRHNVGFDTLDVLADRYRIDVSAEKFKAWWNRGDRGAEGDSGKASDFYEFKRDSLRWYAIFTRSIRRKS